ncbi:unnamed protein product [Tuber aestivum]|uniref:Uncharacterized protein n=1 Tax=Tuber aestivum TaxID=59557 RepID=A0A292Q407_9PEZI|nr:unnamed protein product [Tuber aestivum]
MSVDPPHLLSEKMKTRLPLPHSRPMAALSKLRCGVRGTDFTLRIEQITHFVPSLWSAFLPHPEAHLCILRIPRRQS